MRNFKASLVLLILLVLVGCNEQNADNAQSTQSTTKTDDCKNWVIKKALPSDSKDELYKKLEYNTKMQGLCND